MLVSFFLRATICLYSYYLSFFFSHCSQTNVQSHLYIVTLPFSFEAHLVAVFRAPLQCMHVCLKFYITLCSNYITGVMAVTLPYSAAVNYALSVPWFCPGQGASRKLSCKETWTSRQMEPVFSSNHSGTINKSAQSSVGQNINQTTLI